VPLKTSSRTLQRTLSDHGQVLNGVLAALEVFSERQEKLREEMHRNRACCDERMNVFCELQRHYHGTFWGRLKWLVTGK
jgi:hypothetical protein